MICAICSQAICGHSDLEFAGLVPPRHSPAPVMDGVGGFSPDDDEASQHSAVRYTDKYVSPNDLTMILDPVIVQDGNKAGVWL